MGVRADIIEVEKLEKNLKYAFDHCTKELYENTLKEYDEKIRELKKKDCDYPWERLLELEDRHDVLNRALPNVTDEEFEEYIHTGNLLAVLYVE